MKLALVLFVALLAACSQAPNNSDTASVTEAATSPAGTMPPQQPTQAAQDMKMSEAEHQAKAASEQPTQAATVAKAEGTVESMDESAGKITIAHGPVDVLKWPAMTMAFKASPEQLASVKAGQKVHFEFQSKGMEATITRIEIAK
ncbi:MULTISPECIES: copper-binding protein [Thermomonas]|jgi:Cu(I)/Ag(I) efflux system protein CusF|uniref:copper-binding protein n=1 Tax=Thermomonas TaxID=141948 RepID=UPI00200B53D9|nr:MULTISPECIES: copper-binding protein [Thermomonas]